MAIIPEKFTDPATRAFIADSAIKGSRVKVADAESEIKECIKALNKRAINDEINDVEQKIHRNRQDGLPTRELMVELINLQKSKRALG